MTAATLTAPPATRSRLLSGPHRLDAHEPYADHAARLGPRPGGGQWLLDEIARSGLRGRGGAWFPTGRKWSAVARRTGGTGVVVVNAEEGEPLSAKDRTLVALRPHLVLDGAVLAAESVGAAEVVVYLARGHRPAHDALRRALRERRRAGLSEPSLRLLRTAHRYVAGESSAVAQRVAGGPAKPLFTPPYPTDGIGGRHTLVQNAETLAHAGLIARYGSAWFRECGTAESPGTTLMTVSGNVRNTGVYEVDLSSTVGAVLEAAGGTPLRPGGALLGGYFGSWVTPDTLADLPLDTDQLRTHHQASLGCGILAVLPAGACPLAEAARILRYLAGENAGQCGPCVHGLPAIAASMERVARSQAAPDEIERLRHLAAQVRGRGACHHPDGAVWLLDSVMRAFPLHVAQHLRGYQCPGLATAGFPAPPGRGRGWR